MTLDAVESEIAFRDKQDSEREIAPLAKADDAVLVDSTNMTVDEVVDFILKTATSYELQATSY